MDGLILGILFIVAAVLSLAYAVVLLHRQALEQADQIDALNTRYSSLSDEVLTVIARLYAGKYHVTIADLENINQLLEAKAKAMKDLGEIGDLPPYLPIHVYHGRLTTRSTRWRAIRSHAE